MRRLLIALALLLAGAAIVVPVMSWRDGAPAAPVPPAASNRSGLAPNEHLFATEQEWIANSVAEAIAGIARFPTKSLVDTGPTVKASAPKTDATSDYAFVLTMPGLATPIAFHVVDHLWSPATYAGVAKTLMTIGPASTSGTAASLDLDVRARLTDLRVETMLAENQRVSAVLVADMRSPAAHEAAALLVGSMALGESAGVFTDIRPALSRMTAHLTVAHVSRGQRPPSGDGALALVVLTALIGRQREALEHVEAFGREAASAADRAWVQALRYRITGDWRRAPQARATLLEQLEYGRALRERLGDDALLDFLERSSTGSREITDWQRIALQTVPTIEAGHWFASEAIDTELTEARLVWTTLRGGPIAHEPLIAQLNASPADSITLSDGSAAGVQVLDWGLWAAFLQRHLCKSLTAAADHVRALGKDAEHDASASQYDKPFGSLTLYPLVLWWIASNPADHDRGVTGARTLVQRTPELVPASAWNYITADRRFPQKPIVFPFEAQWFTPAVPAGTAFDLGARSLRPGCPRPPTRAHAAAWAKAMPYDSWTVWGAEWLGVDGKPSLAAVRKASGPLLEYDATALSRVLDHMEASPEQRIAMARALCEMSASRCDVLGNLLLSNREDASAVEAYERWSTRARDRVGVANGLTWLVRYYDETGKPERAEELARMAADAGSVRGLETLAHLLDRAGKYDEAEALYRRIASRYRDNTSPLGTFLMRQAIRTADKSVEKQAWDMLRPDFPTGLEAVALHALPVLPADGVRFQTFGARAEAIGLRPTDLIVGLDGWRVHNVRQFNLVSRFSHDPAMTLVVWRGSGYEQIHHRVPQRSLGVTLTDARGVPGA